MRFLRAGLKTSREHFRREEETVFPLFEKLFDPATLEALGAGASGNAPPLWPHGFENALRGRLWNPEYCYQSALSAEPAPRHHPRRADLRHHKGASPDNG